MLIFVEGGKPENPKKNPRSKDENQQQTQPTCDTSLWVSNNPKIEVDNLSMWNENKKCCVTSQIPLK